VEETFLAEGPCEEGVDLNHDFLRWGVAPEEEGQSHSKIETKWKRFEKKAQSDMGCQNKSIFSFLNEGKRVQGVSEGGAAFSAANLVNVACTEIHHSLVNLFEGV